MKIRKLKRKNHPSYIQMSSRQGNSQNKFAYFRQIKSEDGFGMAQCSSDWATYRFHQSTFEQIKQSVKKAKAALQDRSTFLTTSAFR